MVTKIISGILIAITVYLNIKHGWAELSNNLSLAETKMMESLEIGKNLLLFISILSLSVCGLVIFPQTFFVGNLLNAFQFLLIMGLALRVENFKVALIEIPFLMMPLLMIWLGHPMKR